MGLARMNARKAMLLAGLILLGLSGQSQTDARELVQSGIFKAKMGDYQAAIDDFNQAISLGTKPSEYFASRGAAKASAGLYQEAEQEYTGILNLQPGLAEAWYQRGVARHYLRDTGGACDDWNTALLLGFGKADALIHKNFE